MALRRSPVLTPRSLAALRANALKSTGPRTPCGKARVSLNALKHGRAMGPAGRAPRFRERLLRAGYPQQEALYDGLRSCLAQAFGAQNPRSRRRIDQMAASAWCQAVDRRFQNKAGIFFGIKCKSLAVPFRRLASAPAVPRPGLLAKDWAGLLGAAPALPHRGAPRADPARAGTVVLAEPERGPGEPDSLPGVPAEAAGLPGAAEIRSGPQRRAGPGMRALAASGAEGEVAAPAAGGRQPGGG